MATRRITSFQELEAGASREVDEVQTLASGDGDAGTSDIVDDVDCHKSVFYESRERQLLFPKWTMLVSMAK
jgi:hypothetical protein